MYAIRNRVETFVVSRSNYEDENTFAVVELEVPATCDWSRAKIADKFCLAIYDWARTQGQAMLRHTGDDLNIGDFANFTSENFESFLSVLASVGLLAVRVQTYCDESPVGWNYDDNLYQQGKYLSEVEA